MPYALFYLLAVALTLTALALARQIRLRRALEQLLRRILSHWRTREPTENPRPTDAPPAPADRRLR